MNIKNNQPIHTTFNMNGLAVLFYQVNNVSTI